MSGEGVQGDQAPQYTDPRRTARSDSHLGVEGLLNQIRARVAAEAQQLGLALVGVAPAVDGSPPRAYDPFAAYRAWLEAGFYGEMAYLAWREALARREDLRQVLPGVRSVIVVAALYAGHDPPAEGFCDRSRGLVARYAWGEDYHDILISALEQIAASIRDTVDRPIATRVYVDTGPLLERDLAVRAGLGFIGRNTCLIHPRLGSWLLLGELLLDLDLGPPGPIFQAHPSYHSGTCGRCTRCLDACPTHAFPAPYLLDARRCISYLTIELKGPIPRHLRPLLGHRIFGCDVCQTVCPWNRVAQDHALPHLAFRPQPDRIGPSLVELLALDEEGFRRRFRHSALWRARRRGLLRNVAVALGNSGDPAIVPALVRALDDAEPLVRGHAAWALGQIGSHEAQKALQSALAQEADQWVREEIQAALSHGALTAV